VIQFKEMLWTLVDTGQFDVNQMQHYISSNI